MSIDPALEKPAPCARRFRVGWIAGWVAALGLAIGAWSVFPDTVIVFNDDFGYLRSIQHTLERGRPWTDDWLEPWAASLSGLSALVFRTTGSFRFATHGVQVAAIVVMAWAVWRVLRDRGVGRVAAVLTSLLLLTFPTLLFKSYEFGSMVLSVPCLLWCAVCAARQRWVAFALVWLAAVATRQSAAAWLALPAWEAWRLWRGTRGVKSRQEWISPAAVVAFGLLAYWALTATMNETYAQRTITRSMFSQWQAAAAWQHTWWALGVSAVAAGFSAFVQRVGASESGAEAARPAGSSATVWAFRVFRLLAAIGVVWFIAADPRRFVAWEHTLLGSEAARWYLGLLGGVAVAGWLRGGFTVQPGWIAVAVAAAGLVALRGMVWDYYFTDVALAAALAVGPMVRRNAPAVADPVTPGAGRGNKTIRLAWQGTALVIAGMLAWWHGGFVREQKRFFDGQVAIVTLSETALRAGRIAPTEISLGPFGYQGWHWYPHFVKQDGPRGEFIAEFTGYIAENSLEFMSGAPGAPPWEFGRVQLAAARGGVEAAWRDVAGNEFAAGVYRWEWRQAVRFALRVPATPARAPRRMVDAARIPYQPQRFPLNDAEWRELLGSWSVR